MSQEMHRVTPCPHVMRRIPFYDPQVLMYIHIAYMVTQITVLGAYYYIGLQVRVPPPFDLAQRSCAKYVDQEEERPDSAQVWCVAVVCLSGYARAPR